MRYLHTMIRVADPEAAVRFFTLLGLKDARNGALPAIVR